MVTKSRQYLNLHSRVSRETALVVEKCISEVEVDINKEIVVYEVTHKYIRQIGNLTLREKEHIKVK